MSTFNYSRSQQNDIMIKEDRLFDAVLSVARSDDGAVSLTGHTIVMNIYSRDSVVYSLSTASEITVSATSISFDTSLIDLEPKSYDYILYDSTNNHGISHGKLIVI